MTPRSGFNPLHKNRLKTPAKRAVDPTVQFALDTDMITQDEFEACLKGDMAIKKLSRGMVLLNLNTRHFSLKVGEQVMIQMGRGTQVRINQILGLDE